jgi:hypothetical protein
MNLNTWNLKIFLVIILGLVSANAYATTYYVRPDGGTASQCTGLADAPYPGSGLGQSCAFAHPFWAIAPQGNNPTKMVGGDTLIVDGSNNAQYMFGYGAPNTGDGSKCSASWPWDCYLRSIPSGPSALQPTRVLGKGWDNGCASPPQFWGNEHLALMLNLNGSSNVEIQCIEVTDHSSCQENGPNPCNRDTSPYGPWASTGISASDSSNVLLRNVNIHGMAHDGINAGRLRDWTLENTQIVANSISGWNGDIGKGVSSNSGTMTFDHVRIEYNGCGETYPGKLPYNCYSQSQGGYGDGIGTQQTGANWNFIDSNVSHNTQDGIDLLYADGTGTVTINRTRAEGNAGNQIKSATNTIISNSLAIGNCGYFKNNPITWQSSTFDHCRAAGNTVALGFIGGTTDIIRDSTITSNGNDLIISIGSTCNGTESISSTNNVFLGGPYLYGSGDSSALYYPSGATGNADGPCGTIRLNDDYSVIYGTKNGASDCSGKPHSKCVNPQLVDSMASYYSGNSFNASLQSLSPAIGTGLVISGISTLDYNSIDRGTSAWDVGAIEHASTISPLTLPLTPSVTTYSPTVNLINPVNQSSFTTGSNVTLSATASETNGTIATVNFYNGATLLGTSTTSPYTYNWNNVPAGAYTLTATAIDSKGVSVTSNPVSITVTDPLISNRSNPVVSITAPTNQSTFTEGENLTITANASETNGAIASVSFYNGVSLLGTSTSSPYSYVWNNLPAGSYTLTAKATDDQNTSATSNPVFVTVNSAPAPSIAVQEPVTIRITDPSNGETIPVGSDITITTATTGNIAKVNFYNRWVYLGSSDSAPYTFTLTNASSGVYRFIAKAVDDNGNTVTSNRVFVKVR